LKLPSRPATLARVQPQNQYLNLSMERPAWPRRRLAAGRKRPSPRDAPWRERPRRVRSGISRPMLSSQPPMSALGLRFRRAKCSGWESHGSISAGSRAATGSRTFWRGLRLADEKVDSSGLPGDLCLRPCIPPTLGTWVSRVSPRCNCLASPCSSRSRDSAKGVRLIRRSRG